MPLSRSKLLLNRSLLLGLALGLACVDSYLAFERAPGLLPVMPWLLSLPLCIAAFPDKKDAQWTRSDHLIAAALFVLAVLSRLLFLDRWPSFINPDEPIFGLLSVDLLDGKSPPFVRGWFGEPYISLVPFAIGLQVLGRDILALRVPDGIIGAVAIPGLYLTGKEAFGRIAGLFAALFLLLSVPAFHLSRTGLSNIQAVTVIVFGAGALLLVFRDPERPRQWAIVGLTLGLAFCVFSSALVWPVIAVITLLPFWPTLARRRELFFRSAVPVVTCFFIAAAPILAYLSTAPGDLGGHALSMAVWNQQAIDHEIYSYHLEPGDIAGMWRIQVERSLGGFVSVGDTQTDYDSERGLLDPVAAVAFVVGLGALLLQWRRPSTLLTISWIVLTLVLGSVIIEDPPQSTKLLVLVPATCMVSGLGLERVLAALLGKEGRGSIVVASGIVCIVIGGILGFSYYFGRYQLVPSQGTTLVSRYARSMQQNRSIFLVDLGVPPGNEMIRFLAPNARVFAWDTNKPAPAIPANTALSFVMPYSGDDAGRALSAVMSRYPSGAERTLYDSNGRPILRVWEVPPNVAGNGLPTHRAYDKATAFFENRLHSWRW